MEQSALHFLVQIWIASHAQFLIQFAKVAQLVFRLLMEFAKKFVETISKLITNSATMETLFRRMDALLFVQLKTILPANQIH